MIPSKRNRSHVKKNIDYKNIAKNINYKNMNILTLFVTKQGKILPRRVTRVNIQQQKKLTKAIKYSRFLSLFNYLKKSKEFSNGRL